MGYPDSSRNPFDQDREVASARARFVPTQPVQEARDGLRVIVEMGSEVPPKPIIRVHDPLPVCRAAGRWKPKLAQHVYTRPHTAFMVGDWQETCPGDKWQGVRLT